MFLIFLEYILYSGGRMYSSKRIFTKTSIVRKVFFKINIYNLFLKWTLQISYSNIIVTFLFYFHLANMKNPQFFIFNTFFLIIIFFVLNWNFGIIIYQQNRKIDSKIEKKNFFSYFRKCLSKKVCKLISQV